MLKFKKTVLTVLIGAAGMLSTFSISAGTPGLVTDAKLKTVELVPVKFERAPSHAPVQMITAGKHNFAIVADLKAESRMQGRNKTDIMTEYCK